jgi:hypothetical protein
MILPKSWSQRERILFILWESFDNIFSFERKVKNEQFRKKDTKQNENKPEERWIFFFQQNDGRSFILEETLLTSLFFQYFSFSLLLNTHIKY